MWRGTVGTHFWVPILLNAKLCKVPQCCSLNSELLYWLTRCTTAAVYTLNIGVYSEYWLHQLYPALCTAWFMCCIAWHVPLRLCIIESTLVTYLHSKRRSKVADFCKITLCRCSVIWNGITSTTKLNFIPLFDQTTKYMLESWILLLMWMSFSIPAVVMQSCVFCSIFAVECSLLIS